MIGRLWSRWRDERRRVPDALWHKVVDDLPFLAALDADEGRRLRELAEAFLAEKEFSAAAELALDDEICVTIAAQACLPILAIGLAAYRGWRGIVVYADEFVIPRRIEDEFGVVHEYDEVAAGEAWAGGPVLVSWHDAQMAGSGYNVVIHEFAHKLDMLAGDIDGVPLLPTGVSRQAWDRALTAAYEDFCGEVDRADRRGEETAIDPYAAEHPAEFFAVVSESFFEDPQLVLTRFPEFYALLVAFYRQDPAARLARLDSPPTST